MSTFPSPGACFTSAFMKAGLLDFCFDLVPGADGFERQNLTSEFSRLAHPKEKFLYELFPNLFGRHYNTSLSPWQVNLVRLEFT
jgi:hypothetical protein